VTSVAREHFARRQTLGLIVGACVVLLAGAGHSTSPSRAADEIVQQGTFRISIGSADGLNAAGTVTVIPAPPDPPFTCSDSCSFDYDEGQSLTLTANPNPGSFFHRWRQQQEPEPNPCDSSPFETTCTLRLTGTETNLTAIFLPDQTLLAVGVTGNIDEDGNPAAVTVSAGDDCQTSQNGGDACYYAVAPGSTVTLTPKNTSAATLVSWSVPECPSPGECRIVIDSQLRSVVATFSPMNLNVIVESGTDTTSTVTGPGIDCPNDCSANLAAFTEVTLTANGPEFRGWNGACLEAGTSSTCKIRLSGDDVVGAQFADGSRPNIIPPRIPVSLQVKKSGDGAGTVTSAQSRFRETINCGSGPGCDAYFEQGETARLVADPAAGSAFAGWRVPGGLCSSDVNCRFEVMRVSRLEANFVRRAQPPPPPPPPQPQPQPQPTRPPPPCTVRKDGGPRADRLNGGAGSDAIHGRAGNDRIRGLGGNDCLFGEGGNDQVWGGPGNDAVSGGKGSDRLYGGAGRDTMQGGPGRDRIFAVDRARDVVVCGRGRDTVRADRVDRIIGCESVRRR
jgi:RTX calcium-binding nonapeptide repeat (4 copies)/Divergent InlB B-repeat domain